ncbi:succinoglycan biosynthesis protein ExoL [Yoonia maricola]|uniref:Succinoglycan biosynthesis protein ExoL n=1 Tax=Yoonia maricola TaxID=420999 RepID=A0A2M8WKM5_9RHOB|nr:glycosyltransferase [Yoonia maricola]PJI91460.1 succinoglycan biosynthesis protein ExoL [Yoonia maricola]
MARVFVFAFDLTEASQIRRIKSLQMLEHDVQSAAFQRGNMNADFTPDWPNADLGFVANESYGKRVIGILRGIWRMMRQRHLLKDADVIIARNFDLLIIAWVTRMLSGKRRTPLVYECLDIHGLFTRTDIAGAIMRWCERRLLARVQLLIVSSPGFISQYFKAIQGYSGPYVVIENKLWFDGAPIPRPDTRTPNVPLTIGWVGSIRCAPSLDLLLGVAHHFGDDIAIRIHGNVHRHVLPDFDAQIAQYANTTYYGSYDYPDGLAAVYAACDVVWAQDLWQRGANSDWLLPNRIYEASWFGCPSIAVGDTETGRKVAADGLGFTIDTPSVSALNALIAGLNSETIMTVGNRLLATDDTTFMLRPTDIEEALDQVLPQTR